MPEDQQRKITVEQLAEMTALGFKDMQDRLQFLATREELAEFKSEVIENLRTREDRISNRLDQFLNTIGQDHEGRLSRIERQVNELEKQL